MQVRGSQHFGMSSYVPNGKMQVTADDERDLMLLRLVGMHDVPRLEVAAAVQTISCASAVPAQHVLQVSHVTAHDAMQVTADDEHDLALLGVVGMHDLPRPEVAAAMQTFSCDSAVPAQHVLQVSHVTAHDAMQVTAMTSMTWRCWEWWACMTRHGRRWRPPCRPSHVTQQCRHSMYCKSAM